MSDKEEVSCELSSTTPEDFHPFTWIPGREAGLKKLAAPPKWGVARSFHFNSVSDPTETDREHLLYVYTLKLAVETNTLCAQHKSLETGNTCAKEGKYRTTANVHIYSDTAV